MYSRYTKQAFWTTNSVLWMVVDSVICVNGCVLITGSTVIVH